MHSQTLFLSKIKADHIPCVCVHVTSNAISAGKNVLQTIFKKQVTCNTLKVPIKFSQAFAYLTYSFTR